MFHNRSSILGFSVLAVGIAGAAVFFSQFPTLSLGGITIQTPFLAALVAGFALVPTTVSEYRSGEQRSALQHGLIAIGLPIALMQYPVLPWVGLLAVWASVAVGWKVDRKIPNPIS